MRVLVTGANGFVGSHILDLLVDREIPTSVLLRPTADRRPIEKALSHARVVIGSLNDAASLDAAVREATHIVHCAGATRALRSSDYAAINWHGTRNVLEAIAHRGTGVERLLFISSLAASGPATSAAPAQEDDPCAPVSAYGRSKLAAEQEVRQHCRVPYCILRPPGVYGPRDRDFLGLFRAVRLGLMPCFDGGRQELSLVYVRDLAGVVLRCLTHPGAVGETLNVASPSVVTARGLTEEVARQMAVRVRAVPLPMMILWGTCLIAEAISRLEGRPRTLSRDKYRELSAPGWVCRPARLRERVGSVCSTTLADGIRETQDWYCRQGWLKTARRGSDGKPGLA